MKYINFSTLKSGWKQNKVILLTGRLGYFLQNKKNILNTMKDMICDIQRSAGGVHKSPPTKSLLWPGLLHAGIPGAKTAVPSPADVTCGSICHIL